MSTASIIEHQLRRLAKGYYRARGYYPFSKFGYSYRMDPYHIWLWRWIERDGWEPETFQIFDRYLKSDMVYCDLGAWIGTTSVLFAADRCAKVVCVEPDPEAFRFLQWNIQLNQTKNVTPFNFAVSNKTGCSFIAPFHGVDGDSTSSLIHQDAGSKGVPVFTVSWQDFVDWTALGKVNFIKIDIEGGEFSLLPCMKDYLDKYKPVLYLSTHAPYLERKDRKAEMEKILWSLDGYSSCYTTDLQKVDIDVLVSSKTLNSFCSFLLE